MEIGIKNRLSFDKNAYTRSLCHVLSKAVHNLFPAETLCIEHAISKSLYCVFSDKKPLPPEYITQIKHEMQRLVDANLPFVRQTLPTAEAVSRFAAQGMADKVKLMETARMPFTSFYVLDGYCNFFFGDLLSSTGELSLFDLVLFQEGFLLRAPQAGNGEELEPMVKQDKMFEAYKRHLHLLDVVGLSNVGDLNESIDRGNAKNIILVSEAMQEKQIAHIAEEIARRHEDGVRMVLIAGPSSSGKTTFCKRLQVQLVTNFIKPVGISLDDYFLNREDTPLDENGKHDYESLYTLDLPCFNRDLEALLRGEEIDLPTFDFEEGKRVYRGNKLKLEPQTVLVMEGIHALNPELTAMVDDANKYRVYVSALTSISLDNHNRIPTTDNRLIRRIIRDHRSRGASAKDTLERWQSVRNGEDKWIFPFQENADATFNSAMLYELAALRPLAEPLLQTVEEGDAVYAEACRLRSFLSYFTPIDEGMPPRTSLLREFLGGGDFGL